MDVKKWLEANINNLPEEDRAAAQRLFTGALGQTLAKDAVEQSVFNSQLDRQRNDLQRQIQEREQWNLQWQQKYIDDLVDVGAIDKLAAAGFDVSGLQNTAGGGLMTRQGEQFTKEQVEAMLQRQSQQLQQQFQSQLEPVRAGLVDFTTFVTEASLDYRESFGKKFDTTKFREFAFENRQKHPTLQAAYDAYTADDRKAKDEADRAKWQEDERTKIRQEVMSTLEIPEAAPGGDTGSPFFTKSEAVKPDAQTPSPNESRQNFTRKWAGKDFNLTI